MGAMEILTIETPGLGDRSYVVIADGHAVVVDPQRDVDRVLAILDRHGATLALVCETHVHNDYVTGGLALARATGADYVLNAADDVRFPHRGVVDGQELAVGPMTVQAIATPGHTPTHLSYLVRAGGDAAVFTGGSMLYDTVGRTDLLGEALTDRLTRDQHASVRALARDLDADTAVQPTHGFGSFCSSAGGGGRTSGTIADERTGNIACTTDDVEVFVRTLREGFTAHPPYYRHMAPLNLAGPFPPDLSAPATVAPEELSARVARGDWVVDLRPRRDFAADHLRGSINAEVGDSLATWLGWVLPWGTAVTLVADTDAEVAQAQRELVRIGLDRPLGMAVGGPDAFAAGQDRASHPVATFAEIPADATVVDVRRGDEWGEGHLDGAIHVPMEDLADRADTLPDTTLWVHCASGFRASIAASLLARAGRAVVLVDDDVENAPI